MFPDEAATVWVPGGGINARIPTCAADSARRLAAFLDLSGFRVRSRSDEERLETAKLEREAGEALVQSFLTWQDVAVLGRGAETKKQIRPPRVRVAKA